MKYLKPVETKIVDEQIQKSITSRTNKKINDDKEKDNRKKQ